MTVAPRPLLIDTDMGLDDWLAILYLLKRPEVEIQALTVTGTGLAHAQAGAHNALGLVALGGQPGIPVAVGRETPLACDHVFPDEWRSGVDTVMGLTLPENPNPLSARSAVELIIQVIQLSPSPITILALGPLTNLAEALHAQPNLKGNIAAIYYMGGAIDVEGNIASSNVGIDNPHAEWNIYADPHAAKQVFESGVPITLIPLDATNAVPGTSAFVNRLATHHPTPEATFVWQVLDRYRPFLDGGGFYFWDPLAAALLTHPDLGKYATQPLTVVDAEGPESGRLVPRPNASPVRYATWADAPAFENLFFTTLTEELITPRG